MNMTVRNTTFKNRASHLVNNVPGPSKTQANYCLVRKDQRKDSDDCITQHRQLISDFKIRKVNDTWRKFKAGERYRNYTKTEYRVI